MIHDSNLQALRSGLPWIFLGFIGLALSLGLWLISPGSEQGAFLTTSNTLGAAGSGLFLLGLLQLARGRVARCFSGALLFAFAAWVAEFSLRMTELVSEDFDGAGLRWLSAALACTALGRGVIWLWDRNVPDSQRETWRRTSQLFAIQICAALSLCIASATHDMSTLAVYRRVTDAIPFGIGVGLVWLIFAGPYVHLYVSVRRTARCVNSRTSVTEMLHAK